MISKEIARPLAREFYERHPALVAPDLLGKVLVRVFEGRLLTGRIVETEAYSAEDPASHGFAGMTARNRAMFGAPGHAYIYLIHGRYHCFNITARNALPAGAVLIRALEPLTGIETMQQMRGRQDLRALASGPAKLAQALSIDLRLYGVDLTFPGEVYVASAELTEPVRREEIVVTGRVGLSRAIDTPWRFYLRSSAYVSR